MSHAERVPNLTLSPTKIHLKNKNKKKESVTPFIVFLLATSHSNKHINILI